MDGGDNGSYNGIFIMNLETGQWLQSFECPITEGKSVHSDWSSPQIISSDKIIQQINIWDLENIYNSYEIFNQFQLIR